MNATTHISHFETSNTITRAVTNIITRAKQEAHERAIEWATTFHPEDPTMEAQYEELFTAEALAKLNRKPEKISISDYVPSWMSASRWTTGERRKAAKLKAYGINRASGYHDDHEAEKEHMHPNSYKPAIYVTATGFHRNPRPTWTKKRTWTA